jgi:mannose-6-phosphate isomerase-like protein (cupin superfamily)
MYRVWMHRRTALLVVLGMSVIGGVVGAQTGPLMVTPTELTWVDGPPTIPPGAKMAVIHGDASKAGLYALRLKLPADYKVAPHRHPVDEHVTVISGTVYFGIGEKFEPEKAKAFPAGSFIIVPAETPHFVWVKEETVIQGHAMGPTGMTYLNPADDPRKK